MRADLLAIDLDGTLLTGARLPHPDSADAILRARAAGMKVVLASGRIRPSMLQYAEPLGIVDPMICSNGGHAIGPDGAEMFTHLLPLDAFDAILEYVESVNAHISIYTRDELLFLRETSWGETYARRVRSVMPKIVSPAEARSREVLKMILIDRPERIPLHVKAVAPLLNPALCRMTESEAEYLEFLPTQVSKGAALETMCGVLGVPAARTAAIGDYLNDLEMLTFAGHSAAVANGAEGARTAAQRVVVSNEEGGVAQFIDWLLQNG
ncbi:MAG: Cof-type HAD-IIB family hydrolase [Fimbriimonas sp.]